jgi:hypothetical protein
VERLRSLRLVGVHRSGSPARDPRTGMSLGHGEAKAGRQDLGARHAPSLASPSTAGYRRRCRVPPREQQCLTCRASVRVGGTGARRPCVSGARAGAVRSRIGCSARSHLRTTRVSFRRRRRGCPDAHRRTAWPLRPASLCITAWNAAMSAASMLSPTWLGRLGSAKVRMSVATDAKTSSRLGEAVQWAISSTSWVAINPGIRCTSWLK